jgi:tetratricopeptide (TPR) repeat protein
MSRIFLSHSNEDSSEAVAIRDWLNEKGWEDVFLDLGPVAGDHTGEGWRRALHEYAARCEAVVFLVSRNWLKSERQRSEYEFARRLNKRVFVTLVEQLSIKDLPSSMRDAHRTLFLAGSETKRLFRVTPPGYPEEREVAFSSEGLEQLEAELTRARIDPRSFSWPPESEPERAPYRGLEPLQATDAGIFFGRDEALVEVLDALRGLAEAPPPRLFSILGESGAGKSSFLRAGVWPRLARDDASFLPLPVIRPEFAPLSGANGLVAALCGAAEIVGLATTRAQIREAVAGGATALRPFLKDLKAHAADASLGAEQSMIVVSVDQAEELFCEGSKTEAETLLTLLRDLLTTDDPAVTVLFAIRSEFFGSLERAKPLEELRQRIFGLPPIPRSAYRRVIESPAERLTQAGRNFEVEQGLTQALSNDMEKAGASALPLLAFALEQLYRFYGAENCITRSDYEKCGGLAHAIDGALGRVLVAADSDDRIPRDKEARLALLRRGLIPALACVSPETRTARRGIARLEQIPEDARPLIELLCDQRLVARWADPTTGEANFELAHELLLHRWPQLKRWLEEDFGRLAVFESVKRASREWDANARSSAWASHGGERLEEAERLYARPDFTALLDATDRAYLAACIKKEKAAREAKEKQRLSEEKIERGKTEELAKRAGSGRLKWIYSIGLGTALALATLLGSVWQFGGADKSPARSDQARNTLAQTADTTKGLMSDLTQRLSNVRIASIVSDILSGARKPQDQAPSNEGANNERRRDESVSLNKIVEARLAAGDLKGARAAAQQSAALMEAVSASNPADYGWRRDLSVSYEKLGDVQKAQGDLAGALKSYRNDVATAEALVASNSNNAQWRWDLSVSYEKLADVLKSQGDLTGALKLYRDDLAIREAVSASDPANAEWRRDLAVAIERVGATLAEQTEIVGAVAAFERALSIYQEIVRARPDDRQAVMFSIVPHWRLAGLDKPRAREHLEAALAILESLAAADRLDAKRRGWISEVKAELAALDDASFAPKAPAPEPVMRKE